MMCLLYLTSFGREDCNDVNTSYLCYPFSESKNRQIILPVKESSPDNLWLPCQHHKLATSWVKDKHHSLQRNVSETVLLLWSWYSRLRHCWWGTPPSWHNLLLQLHVVELDHIYLADQYEHLWEWENIYTVNSKKVVFCKFQA